MSWLHIFRHDWSEWRSTLPCRFRYCQVCYICQPEENQRTLYWSAQIGGKLFRASDQQHKESKTNG